MFENTYASPDIQEVLGERSFVAALLRFEAALARAQAAAGLIPESAAQSIIGTCKVELFDVGQILREGSRSGNIVVPLVGNLRETVALFNQEAAACVHLGCSSRDAMETAKAVVTRTVLDRIEADLVTAASTLLTLIERHAASPQLRRTSLQAGPVSSFGLRCAGWANPLVHGLQRLRRTADSALCVRLGSAFPAQTVVSGVADQVARLVAAELSLGVNSMPGGSCGDGWVALACELGMLAAHLGRIARDLALLGQPEIGEVQEAARPAGGRPPAVSACLAAAQTAPQRVAVMLAALAQQDDLPLEAAPLDAAEWALLLMAVHGSARALAQTLTGLLIETDRMQRNVGNWRAQLAAGEVGQRPAEDSAQLAHRQLDALRATLRALQAKDA